MQRETKNERFLMFAQIGSPAAEHLLHNQTLNCSTLLAPAMEAHTFTRGLFMLHSFHFFHPLFLSSVFFIVSSFLRTFFAPSFFLPSFLGL
jgi:hypothetical protein